MRDPLQKDADPRQIALSLAKAKALILKSQDKISNFNGSKGPTHDNVRTLDASFDKGSTQTVPETVTKQDKKDIGSYFQPFSGLVEKHIDIKLLNILKAGTRSTYQSLKDYDFRNVGRGLGAAENLIHHVIQNKLRVSVKPDHGFWNKTLIVTVQCKLIAIIGSFNALM